MTAITLRAGQLAQNGDAVGGVRLLEQAIAGGDAEAAWTLAHWRLSGQLIRRDLSLARQLFGRAAALGVEAAGPIHIALLANGAGSARRWGEALAALEKTSGSDEQMRLLRAMNLDGEGDPASVPPSRTVRDDPEIRIYPSFMTAEECAYLRDCARPMLQPSVVVDPRTGAFIQDPVRTSTVASFPFVLERPFVHAINRRIAGATGTEVTQGEPLQVLRYAPGEQYKLHNDALPNEPNQRCLTFLVYLSDDFEGGHTIFPGLDLSYRGQIGDALSFRNVRADGTVHPLSRHAGEPVTAGEKYLLSRWIRTRPLDLTGPPGRPL